ncbi:unnamed protein product, partial [Ectocarpus sp. 12 AP-2014]
PGRCATNGPVHSGKQLPSSDPFIRSIVPRGYHVRLQPPASSVVHSCICLRPSCVVSQTPARSRCWRVVGSLRTKVPDRHGMRQDLSRHFDRPVLFLFFS